YPARRYSRSAPTESLSATRYSSVGPTTNRRPFPSISVVVVVGGSVAEEESTELTPLTSLSIGTPTRTPKLKRPSPPEPAAAPGGLLAVVCACNPDDATTASSELCAINRTTARKFILSFS